MKPSEYSDEELTRVAEINKEVFGTHNIFSQEIEKIIEYYKNINGDLILIKEGEDIIASVVLTHKSSGSHSLWKVKHLGVAKEYQGKGNGSKIMETIDATISEIMKKEELKTAKVEIFVSEPDSAAVGFYKQNGFGVEGELANHYRHGEKCFVLGKTKTN